MKYTKQQRIADFYRSMARLGFTPDESNTLRRAQMTLHRWAERECNGEIQRDEETGKVYAYSGNYVQANDPRRRHRVADLETGAWKRVASVVEARNDRENADAKASRDSDHLIPYHQTDPRGCALYLVRTSELQGHSVSAVYNRGFGVCY